MSVSTHLFGALVCLLMLLGLGVPFVYAWLFAAPVWAVCLYVVRA